MVNVLVLFVYISGYGALVCFLKCSVCDWAVNVLCEFISCVRKCSRKHHLRYFITSNVLQKVIDVPIAPGGTSLQTIRHPSHLSNVEINRRIIFTHSVSHCLVLEEPKGCQYLMQTADPAICYCPGNYSGPSQITVSRIRKRQ